MPKILLIICAALAFLMCCTVFALYFQALLAYKNRIIPVVAGDVDSYAGAITAQIPEGNPVIMLVPLNGFPDGVNHPSVKNALVALQVLEKIPVKSRYLILSEGYTGQTCLSGAQATAQLMGLESGYNPSRDVIVLLEENARTTLENILNTRSILKENFAGQDAYLVVAGMSDTYPLPNVDTGHGARAQMFAKNNYAALPNIHVLGLLPTNLIDSSIAGYSHSYNLMTMYLGANGVLNLPWFSKRHISTVRDACVEM